jgi:hypothetical protein
LPAWRHEILSAAKVLNQKKKTEKLLVKRHEMLNAELTNTYVVLNPSNNRKAAKNSSSTYELLNRDLKSTLDPTRDSN